MKAMIRHLPHNTYAEDISDRLVSLGCDVISVKQKRATRRSPSDGSTTINFPLFLITLARTAKSQENFRLTSLCHIAIRVEAYRAQNGLRSAITASSSVTSGHTKNNLPAACGAEGVTCTRSAPRKGMHLPPQSAATAGWRKEKNHIPQIIGAADTRRRRSAEEEVAEDTYNYNGKFVLF
jgi:hypothetical protein